MRRQIHRKQTPTRRVEGENVPHLAGVVVGWSCDRQVRFFFIGQIRRVDDRRLVVVWVASDSEWRVWLIGE